MAFTFFPETNWVDIIVVIFLIRGIYIGLEQGFSVEVFKLLGALATCVLSLLCYDNAGTWLAAHSFLSLQTAKSISFIVLIFTLLIVFRMLRILLFRVLHLELFGSLERWGGFILGTTRSIIFASLFLFVLTLLPVEYIKESVEKRSFSGPYLKEIAPKVVDFILIFTPNQNTNNR